MSDSLPQVKGSPIKIQQQDAKSKTSTAGRVMFFSRTSDIHGSFNNSDLEGYLTLVRRKIQEKCGTIQDLIYNIRRTRLSEGANVTPTEFRYTLIKFGCILPQPIVDKVFAVFDSDRSGTMDFDEFASWIMSAEFRPSQIKKKPKTPLDIPEERLRLKLLDCINEHREVFTLMKRRVNFMELISDVTRKNMKLTERDARALFLLFDPEETGSIDSKVMVQWATTGVAPPPPAPERTSKIPLGQAIFAVCGQSAILLQKCFDHISRGQGIKLGFDEFRRALLSNGLGQKKNNKEVFQLYVSCGGGEGSLADMDTLLDYLEPLVANSPSVASVGLGGTQPRPMLTTVTKNASRADRLLRESVRKSYKLVKKACEAIDRGNTGLIDDKDLHRIINEHCIPMSYQDYRYMLQLVNTDSLNRVDWHHFLSIYNPARGVHLLTGSVSASALGETGSSSSSQLVKSSSSSSTVADGVSSDTAELDLDEELLREVLEGANLRSESAPSASSAALGLVGDKAAAEMRKKWQTVLRECQRSDPDRTGLVSRISFIAALEYSNLGKTMSAEAMSKLADDYTLGGGLVDYLNCFRRFLNEIISRMPVQNPASVFKAKEATTAKDSLGSHPWEYGYQRNKHDTPYWQKASTVRRDVNLSDEFSTMGTSTKNRLGQKGSSTSLSASAGNTLTDSEREQILSKYEPKVISICQKCQEILLPAWRILRNEFKRAQINNQKGSIIANNFMAILEQFGVRLSSSEVGAVTRAFRSFGTLGTDIIKFDEFLRVCLVSKSLVK